MQCPRGESMKRFVFFVLILSFVALCAPPGASAQNADPCATASTWWFPDPIPPGWYYLGPYPAPFMYLIGANSSGKYFLNGQWIESCFPPNAHKETCPTCPSANRPISLATGNTYIEETDVNLPGLGGGLKLTRTWLSMWPQTQLLSSVGIFGPNWRSTYEERVFMGSDNWMKYSRGNGSYWSFGVNNSGVLVVAAPANASATLSQTASYWLLRFQNGEQRHFDLNSGTLTAIVDRNGNTTQISYDSSGRLATITDPASRHLYFNYQSLTSALISSVTSDFGVTVSYAYDAQNRLSQVTLPDLTTITFTYNSASQITQVTDMNGKVLESHTYDSAGHGLTASQANGINSVSVTAPQ